MPPKKRSVPEPEEHKAKQTKTQELAEDRKEEIAISSLKDFVNFPHPVSVVLDCDPVLPYFINFETLRQCVRRWLTSEDAYDFNIVDFVLKCGDTKVLYVLTTGLSPLYVATWTRLVDFVAVLQQFDVNVVSLVSDIKTYFRMLRPGVRPYANFPEMTLQDVVYVATARPRDFQHYPELCASYTRLKTEICDLALLCRDLERKIGTDKFLELVLKPGNPENDPRLPSHKDVYVPTPAKEPESPVY